MNRQIKLSKTAVTRTIAAINASIGRLERAKIENKEAKVYLVYNGETLEAYFLDFSIVPKEAEDEKAK